MFEIEHAYLRSRWKRVQRFMKDYYDEIFENGSIKDKEPWEKKLQNALQNRLEPEFQLPENSTWHLIIDKNERKADAFKGYLDEDCLFLEEKSESDF